jgi:cell division protein FtsN
MPPTYYVIELSARWLTAILVSLAVVLVLSFAFGYGAAWSVLSSKYLPDLETSGPTAHMTPTEIPETMVGSTLDEPEATPTPTRRAVAATPRQTPTATSPPRTAATAIPAPPEPSPAPSGSFWVQVLAAGRREAIDDAQKRLDGLGFSLEHQKLVESRVAGGNTLYKLRVGPLPDRESADRVVHRMQAAGFPDAWVVVP